MVKQELIPAVALTAMALLTKNWHNRDLMFLTKLKLDGAMMLSILLYCCASWTLNADMKKRIQAFEMKCYRGFLRISRVQHKTNGSRLKQDPKSHYTGKCEENNNLMTDLGDSRWSRLFTPLVTNMLVNICYLPGLEPGFTPLMVKDLHSPITHISEWWKYSYTINVGKYPPKRVRG